MPTQETKILDNIIASRRALLTGGAAALALSAFPRSMRAANTVTSFTDNDILNFALNLEYLEANFYYQAAFGTTIDVANAASTAAGAAVLGINGTLGNNAAPNTTTGIVANVTGATAVNFTNSLIKAYAVETAIEEGKHVAFLRNALGAGTGTALQVAQPALNLSVAAWTSVANAAGITGTFSPYLNDYYFLIGAYVFEDVGVSAYHGAAPLITNKATILAAAAGIHAVEAYHAGLVRTSILLNDNVATTGLPTGTLGQYTGMISNLRKNAAAALQSTNTIGGVANPEDPSPDDYGLSTYSGAAGQTVALPTGSVQATQIVDADPIMVTGFARSTAQVLNIVTLGGAVAPGIAKGGFFTNGLNGLFI